MRLLDKVPWNSVTTSAKEIGDAAGRAIVLSYDKRHPCLLMTLLASAKYLDQFVNLPPHGGHLTPNLVQLNAFLLKALREQCDKVDVGQTQFTVFSGSQ
jgi:hypothetical protein